ncbi:MAG TPA: hypothetical protein VHO28_14345 [Ignavibacteriales bacterium]|nr:hypothetical protein [Ignavibacteriales bacterium]
MKKLILLSLFSAACFFASCKEEITAEHTNLYDPQMPEYFPTNPLLYSYDVCDDYVQIMWRDKSEGESGFIIYKACGNTVYTAIDTVVEPLESPALSYDYSYRDSFRVEPENSYYYKVSPYSHDNISDGVNFNFNVKLDPPLFYSVINFSSTTASIVWNKSASKFLILEYVLERKIYNGASEFTDVAALNPAESIYKDTALDSTKIYAYRMYSKSKYFRSPYSPLLYIIYNQGWRSWRPPTLFKDSASVKP